MATEENRSSKVIRSQIHLWMNFGWSPKLTSSPIYCASCVYMWGKLVSPKSDSKDNIVVLLWDKRSSTDANDAYIWGIINTNHCIQWRNPCVYFQDPVMWLRFEMKVFLWNCLHSNVISVSYLRRNILKP